MCGDGHAHAVGAGKAVGADARRAVKERIVRAAVKFIDRLSPVFISAVEGSENLFEEVFKLLLLRFV
jgi:hypothetical protein